MMPISILRTVISKRVSSKHAWVTFKRLKVLFVKAEYTPCKWTTGAKLNLFKTFSLTYAVNDELIDYESSTNQYRFLFIATSSSHFSKVHSRSLLYTFKSSFKFNWEHDVYIWDQLKYQSYISIIFCKNICVKLHMHE